MKISVRTPTLKLDARSLFAFKKHFWIRVSKRMEQSVISNIRNRKQADGSRIQRNQQITLDRKRRLQRGSRSLIDNPASHQFIQTGNGSYKPLSLTKLRSGAGFVGVVLGFTNESTRQLAITLQKRGYTGWFGVSQKGMDKIADIYQKEIQKALDRVVKKNKKKLR